jgi:phosphate transport system protein
LERKEVDMGTHLSRELERLKTSALAMYRKVDLQVEKGLKALIEKDLKKAEEVVEGDGEINRLEVEIEEECLKIIALYQPVASDLRYTVAILKMNGELERIGDLAVNIADVVPKIVQAKRSISLPPAILLMAEKVKRMLQSALFSLMELKVEPAYEVLRSDQEVDDLHRSMYPTVAGMIRENLEDVEHIIPLLAISRSLERIADHATNIAEDVIYMVEGKIVRHTGGG